jgi:type I restriction enzyme R subunit
MQFAGHQFADYGLLLRGRPTTVVEAKKTGRDAQVGQEQALQYAQGLRTIHGGPTPFVMYTNGYDFFFWDSDEYPPSKVAGFPTPEDVDWLAQRRETKGALSIELINNVIAGRDY